MLQSFRKLPRLTLVLCAALCLTLSQSVVMAAQQTSSYSGQSPKADARSQLLVSPEWLAKHINDPDLVLLQVGDAEEYMNEHLPRARFASLRSISRPETHDDALSLEMLPADQLRTALEKLGVSDNSKVVVYYGNDWVTPATRVVFTLDYAGLGSRVVLLDGGMQAWKRNGGKVTDAVAPKTKGTLSPLKLRPQLIVDANWVKDNIGKQKIVVVDARAAGFYDGVQTGSGMGTPYRTGHIAGAKSVPFTGISDDQNMFRSQSELAALFAKAGVQPGDTVVAYCHVGQQATGTLFAARLLGYPIKLYDGSFQDWSARSDLPVENPAAGAAARK